jgi:hypothetical protein
MRQTFLAVMAYAILNLFIPTIWERLMSQTPPWVAHLLIFLAAIVCLAFVGFASPIYVRLAHPAEYPWTSTALVVALLAAIGATGWWQFAVSNGAEAKKQPFLINYLPGNCGFLMVEDSGTNSHLNGRRAMFIYDFNIVNNTDSITTLKAVLLTYEQGHVKRETFGVVFPVGALKNGESALMVSSPKGHVLLMNWIDIRLIIAENKEKPPGAIWRGSAIFIFDENLESFDQVLNPKLVVRDYLDRESELSISPQVKSDLKVRFQKFVEHQDDSISWVFP